MKNEDKNTCTKDKKDSEISFSVAFKKDGESFQSIMEKILMNKINKNILNG